MSDSVISVENLSKCYLVGHRSAQRERHITLRDVISREAHNFIRKAADFVRGRQIVQGDEVEEFWALKNISFEVHRGEVLGIIGRNGAGKSTLLKILSRITEPTKGRIRIKGRVTSLLEVGTGFHNELTGRENIYLNGAILGMTQGEVKRKFDEIVAFAEIDKFLDMPVKRYSSGMYVRLAFSVAAHLEPEILMVDEVLAVGDAAFQKKCLGKMSDVAARGGRTVLFVSHNMPSVQALCNRALLLASGEIRLNGDANSVTAAYLNASLPSLNPVVKFRHAIKKAWMENERGEVIRSVNMGDPLRVCFEFSCCETVAGPGFGCIIDDSQGRHIFSISNYMLGNPLFDEIKSGVVSFYVPEIVLLPGTYHVTLCIARREIDFVDYVEHALQFSVLERDLYGSGKSPSPDEGVIYQRALISVS
jgi:lipopolysaccharide transport system ATP-binding protein